MVKHCDQALDDIFAALSDATRRGILAQLALGELPVSALTAPYDITPPAISKHLRVLEEAGLIARRKEGREHRCRLLAFPMKDASEWISQYRRFWNNQFDSLGSFLSVNQLNSKKQTTKTRRLEKRK